MTERLKIQLVYLITAIFVLLNTYLVYKENYFGILVPLAFIMLFLYMFSLDKVLLLAVFVTPLAIDLGDYDLGVNISLPSEPLLIGILFFIILKVLLEGGVERRIMKHPVTLAILFQLSWMLLTCITSELPVVSFKYLLSRLWFVVPMYFGGLMLFRKRENISRFIWAYVISLVIVVFYTTWEHAKHGFSEKTGHWVMSPFYNDHTAYGMILAFFLPIMVGMVFDKVLPKYQRFFSLVTVVILTMALYLSYCRAAWVSVGFALGVWVLVKLRIKFQWIALGTLGLVLAFFAFKFEILDKLEKNKQDASANFIQHIESISNISSDASNLERINRWQAALRMFAEKPVVGWGPGTYQFEYAPYQRSKEKTIISTNLGDHGNAHSEYIGPLSESGVPGLISVILLLIAIIHTGLKVHKRSANKQSKLYALAATIAMITYFVHGIMNNFLNTDKASVPFWGLAAAMVAMDVYYSEKEKRSEEIPTIVDQTRSS